MNNAIQMISIFAAAMAVSFGAIGPALGEGRAVAAAMDAIARQPESAGTISRTLFVGLAMIETMAITPWSSRCWCCLPTPTRSRRAYRCRSIGGRWDFRRLTLLS